MCDMDVLNEISDLLAKKGYSVKPEDDSVTLDVVPGGYIRMRLTCRDNIVSAEILVVDLEEYLREIAEEDPQFDFDEFADEIFSSIRSILLESEKIARNKSLRFNHNMSEAKRSILDAVEEVRDEFSE